jgi:hypothetical protein
MTTPTTPNPPTTNSDQLRAKTIQLITDALATGTFTTDQTAPIYLPGLKVGAQHPQFAEPIRTLLKTIAESIIQLIETQADATIINKNELTQLRATAANIPYRTIDVNCQHGPAFKLHVPPGTNTARINCRMLPLHPTVLTSPNQSDATGY